MSLLRVLINQRYSAVHPHRFWWSRPRRRVWTRMTSWCK